MKKIKLKLEKEQYRNLFEQIFKKYNLNSIENVIKKKKRLKFDYKHVKNIINIFFL